MNERERLLLAFMRGANERNMCLSEDVFFLFCDVLGITAQDNLTVHEILKADIREKFAMSPEFGEINGFLDSLI